MNLKKRILNASAWTLGSYGVENIFRLASSLILSRLLFPEAFGLVSASSSIIVAIGLFSDLGIRAVIIQSPRGDSDDFLRSAWVFQLLRGMLLWLVLVIICSVISLPVASETLSSRERFCERPVPRCHRDIGVRACSHWIRIDCGHPERSSDEVSTFRSDRHRDQDRDDRRHDWLGDRIPKCLGAGRGKLVFGRAPRNSVAHGRAGPTNGLELE